MKIRIHHKTLPRHQNVITKPYPLAAHDMRFCRDTEMITELQGRTTINTDTRAMSDSSSSLENHRAIHLPHRTRPFLVKDTDTAKTNPYRPCLCMFRQDNFAMHFADTCSEAHQHRQSGGYLQRKIMTTKV